MSRIITRPRDNYQFTLVGSHTGTQPVGEEREPYRHPGCKGCEEQSNG